MMYKLIEKEILGFVSRAVKVEQGNSRTFIPFAPDNGDYQNFKKQINADKAQLEDADGNLMTAEQAKEFVKELP